MAFHPEGSDYSAEAQGPRRTKKVAGGLSILADTHIKVPSARVRFCSG